MYKPKFVEDALASIKISALVSGSSGPGSKPGRTHCVALWGEELVYSHSAFLHPGAKMGTGGLNTGGSPAMD